MKHITFILALVLFVSCEKKEPHNYSSVAVEEILKDSLLSIRAIEIMHGSLAFACNNNTYGIYSFDTKTVKTNTISIPDSLKTSFRAVAHTSTDFMMLSVANPALLYKTGDNGSMELVYKETHEKVFYDAMTFWNDKEGIAVGDPTDDCMSLIITRDGGKTWKKTPCNALPKIAEGEAFYAASNTNIAVVGDKTWIVSGGKKSRIFFSPDKGNTWEVIKIPAIQGEGAQGMYSVAFYDENIGVAIGGDYTKPKETKANKLLTKDGGKTWSVLAEGKAPGYKSCIQFIPGSEGKEMVAVGFTGISYSQDFGTTWKELSKESFYTIRFLDDKTAFAAGKGRISKLVFK